MWSHPVGECLKFNVIVPTRERADTLRHCLRTLVVQEYSNLNIIVSDNCSQDDTREVATSFSDDRITYLNTGKRLSMSHNWEFALNHVSDGWVMFLGDDDGLYPWALESLDRLIRSHDVEAVSSACGSFVWPGHFQDSLDGRLLVPLTSSVRVKKTRKELARVFAGKLSYTALPWLYHGGGGLPGADQPRARQGRPVHLFTNTGYLFGDRG